MLHWKKSETKSGMPIFFILLGGAQFVINHLWYADEERLEHLLNLIAVEKDL